MVRSSLRFALRAGTTLGLVAALFASGARAATSTVSAPSATGGVVVVLDCAGVTQQAVPDAAGKFVFSNAPQGECTVSAMEKAPRDAASGLPTGKRMHKPIRYQVTLDGDSSAAADGAAKVVARGMGHELKGHVTLIK